MRFRFQQMLLPCEDNLLRNVTLDRYAQRVSRWDSLPRDIEQAITDVIQREIDLQRRVEILKRDLQYRYDFSNYSAFKSLDPRNDGFIDLFNLQKFFRVHSSFPADKELLAVIRRIDTDGDAKITYSELSDMLRSDEPVHRQLEKADDKLSRSYSQERGNRTLGGGGGGFYSPGKSGGFGSSNRAHSAYGGRGGGSGGFDYSSPRREEEKMGTSFGSSGFKASGSGNK